MFLDKLRDCMYQWIETISLQTKTSTRGSSPASKQDGLCKIASSCVRAMPDHMAYGRGAGSRGLGGDRPLPSGRMPGSLLAALLTISQQPQAKSGTAASHGSPGRWFPASHIQRLQRLAPPCFSPSPLQGNEHFLVWNLCYGPEHKQPITEDNMNTWPAGTPKFL